MRALLILLALPFVGCKDLVLPLNDGGASSAAVTDDGAADDPTLEWAEAPRAVAKDITREYGNPDEAAAGMLIWGARGPFKRTVVYRDALSHNFPKPHADVLEQIVDARIPAAKMSDLAAFDGSVLVDRTKGEIASRCASEGTNILVLNLAMEIVNGTKTPDQARQELASAVSSGSLPTKLAFDPPQGDLGDPDVSAP